jgi:serine/threonine protein kinase/Tol biopolymer transport system component
MRGRVARRRRQIDFGYLGQYLFVNCRSMWRCADACTLRWRQVTPERWQEVKKVLAAALERAPEERRVYLDQACSEPDLRREVESLIAAHEQLGSGFMEKPVFNSALLESGAQLGPYTILGRIGSGGMGEVYRAHDPKLKRDVAIKVLPAVFVNDPDRLARFQREARMLASLNHPNIATIHGLEQSDGLHYLVMELILGESLAQQLRKGPLAVNKVLDLGIQIIDALDAAHAKGIIHRDIKPANIVLSTRGQAKILDFGLAKLTRSVVAPPVSTVSTPEESQSVPGRLLGTLAYMSPEQARGESLDVRTDLFSFGLVIYEMATGRAAFAGGSAGVIFDAILNRQPVLPSQLNRAVPPRLEEIITRAIEKDRKLRYQTAQDLEADLQRLKRDVESGTAPQARLVSQRHVRLYGRVSLFVGGLALIGVLLALLVIAWPLAPRLTESDAITRDGLPKSEPGSFYPVVTDVERLYFTQMSDNGNSLHQVLTAPGESISPTTGETVSTTIPFILPQVADISPDNAELLVLDVAGSGLDSPLWMMATLGGTPSRVGDLEAHSATWAPDGDLVYAKGFDLYRAKTDGSGRPRLIAALSGWAYWPRFSPDGRVLRFTILDPKTKSTSLWEISGDSNPHRLLPGWNDPPAECCGNWSPDGKYFVFQSTRDNRTNIWALGNGALWKLLHRRPVQVTAGPVEFSAPVFSHDGAKLFAVGEERRGELVRYDAEARHLPYLSGISADRFDFSRDGQWVAYVAYPDGTLWRSKADGSQKQPMTKPPLNVHLPRWSPDGRQIAFSGSEGGRTSKIYVIPATGGSPVEVLPGLQRQREPSWSADGRSLVFNGCEGCLAPTDWALYEVKVETRETSRLPDSVGLYEPRWSPDGRYIAAATINSPKLLLFDTNTRKWADLARIGAGYLNWSQDSRYLYTDTFGTDSWIVRIRVPEGTLENVVSLKGLRRAWGSYGPWFGLAPDNSPLIVLDKGSQDIYSIQWPGR